VQSLVEKCIHRYCLLDFPKPTNFPGGRVLLAEWAEIVDKANADRGERSCPLDAIGATGMLRLSGRGEPARQGFLHHAGNRCDPIFLPPHAKGTGSLPGRY
jgi:hypothetical protein